MQYYFVTKDISIHAPHEGVRLLSTLMFCLRSYFNPRTPRGGATSMEKRLRSAAGISIHAPHEGVRRRGRSDIRFQEDFNPRTPRGGATGSISASALTTYFNPRTPRGGATCGGTGLSRKGNISIHAPHEGVRPGNETDPNLYLIFQSTHPTRGCDRNML